MFQRVLILLVVVVALTGAPGFGQSLWIDPEFLISPAVGDTQLITVRAEGFDDLTGVELYLVYDADIFHVDAPPVAGVCPPPDFIVYRDATNDWDPATAGNQGLLRYAAARIYNPSCDTVQIPDQEVVSFTVRREALGISAFQFNLTPGDIPNGEPGVCIVSNGTLQVCDDSTPQCWQNMMTDWPVELLGFTVE